MMLGSFEVPSHVQPTKGPRMTEYTFLIEAVLYIGALGVLFGIAHVWDKVGL